MATFQKVHLLTMVLIKPQDAKYYLSLGLTLVVKHQGLEVIRGNQNTPQMHNFLNLKDHQYFVPINRRNRFLKYLAGQVFIGYFLGGIFGLLAAMFTFILVGNLSWSMLGLLSPFLLVTGVSSLIGFRIAHIARQRITRSLIKYHRRQRS